MRDKERTVKEGSNEEEKDEKKTNVKGTLEEGILDKIYRT